jgi:hypothetical protein
MPVTAHNLYLYQASEDNPAEARRRLESAGFTVIAASQFGVSISGPQALFDEYFKAGITQRPVSMLFGGGMRHEVNSFFMEETPRIPGELHAFAETVYIPRMGHFLSGEGPMPTPAYYALKPPNDISRLTNADGAHARGYRGTGVQVAMVDSGFILDHDYYSGRGYHITVHAAVGSTTMDEIGHGTGIASNLLAIAPDCDFHFYKMSDGFQWASLAAFRMAVQDGARVITNSWGQQRDPILEAEIINAVNAGVTVIFACGNTGPIGWPGCMPQVISVGGAYPLQNGTWQASSYASSGVNGLFPARHCPDLSAIVGLSPRGIFIVMPTMKGAQFDGAFSGGVFPNGDETGADDGWLVASGTSSAAPMVAGAAALLLQAKTSLTPAEIKQTLEDTCIDVVNGFSGSGEAAGIGPDSATGAGMIDIETAVNHVAPITICPRAPTIHCSTAPIIQCRPAPIIPCIPAPTIHCPTAPIRIIPCKVAPIVNCLRAPFICRVTPILCVRAPLEPLCPPAPLQGCQAGPWKEPPIEQPLTPLVPVVVMIEQDQLAAWVAQEAYFEASGDIGVEGEYKGFPELSGCRRGPFTPTVEG